MQSPFLVRLFETLPGPFTLRCLLLVLILITPVVIGSLLVGELSTPLETASGDIYGMFPMSILLTILLVYPIGAYAALQRRAGGTLAGSKMVAFGMGMFGLTLSIMAPLLEADESGWHPYDISQWFFESGHHRIITPFIGWHLGRALHALAAEARNMSNRIHSLQNFDLFDPAPLQAPVKQGLLNVAIVAGFAAMLSPFLIDPRYYDMVAVMAPITLVFASIGFFVPARGVAQRIRREKDKALTQIAPEISARRRAIETLKPGAAEWPAAAQQLESLIAYRTRLTAVREWPFDRSAVSRLGLYMLIPIASWVGAALVEQVIEGVL